MRNYTCDREGCDKSERFELPIQIKGYYPYKGGILIPDNCRRFDFCSKECFEGWMMDALKDKLMVPKKGVDGM